MPLYKVNATIVTFNNCHMLVELLGDLRQQTLAPQATIVVDNASVDGTEQVVRGAFGWVQYHRLAENTGSAGGYSRALQLGAVGSDFVWTLDDDVRLKNDSLEMLLAGFLALKGKRSDVGAVRSVGKYYHGEVPEVLETAPWRGTLFSAEVILQIGYPRTEYFLYGDDLEYSLRMHRHGYYCYWIPASKCFEARTSNKLQFEKMGMKVAIYSSPFRHYYGFRNEISAFIDYRCYTRLMRTLLYALKVLAVVLLWHKGNKREMVQGVLDGVVDGVRQRLGKCERYTPRV